MPAAEDLTRELKFRDPARARALAEALQRNLDAIGRERLGDARLRQPRAGHRPLRPARRAARGARTLIMGRAARCASPTARRWTRRWRWPDRASASAPTVTCCGCPGTSRSLADAQADGGQGRGRLLGAAGGGAGAARTPASRSASSPPASRPPRWPPPPRRWRGRPGQLLDPLRAQVRAGRHGGGGRLEGEADRGVSWRPATPPSSPAGRSSSPSPGAPGRRWWWPASSRSTSWRRWSSSPS